MQPHSPHALAHDSFTRLLHRLQPDAETLWIEAKPLVDQRRGVLIIDDSTLAELDSRKIELVTRHWSGQYRQVITGINLVTLLWTDGDRKSPVDYRIDSKTDGVTVHGRTCSGLNVGLQGGTTKRLEYLRFFLAIGDVLLGLPWQRVVEVVSDAAGVPAARACRVGMGPGSI